MCVCVCGGVSAWVECLPGWSVCLGGVSAQGVGYVPGEGGCLPVGACENLPFRNYRPQLVSTGLTGTLNQPDQFENEHIR